MLVAGTGKATPWRGPTLQCIQKVGSCHGMTLQFISHTFNQYVKTLFKKNNKLLNKKVSNLR
jgi:hypothetical protein